MGGLKFPGAGTKRRKPPKPNLTEGFALPKPTRRGPRPAKRMEQRTALRRLTRINPKRSGHRGNPNPAPQAFPKPAGRAYDTPYLLEVKKLPCLLKGKPGHVCDGPSEADHGGERPYGRKCDDRKSLPFCPGGHRQRQRYQGYFKGWDKVRMRHWLEDRIAEVQAKLSWVPVATEAA